MKCQLYICRGMFFIGLFILPFFICAQTNTEFDGQLSLIGSYSPDSDLEGFLGTRYIPKFSVDIARDSAKASKIDFEAALNVWANTLFSPFNNEVSDASIQPYRFWTRYSTRQFELRIGLQKIDFGAARLLRPLQWFNQIDPRDPLQLTNGVYGALGRYYFLNNANIWVWGLIGNSKTRGFDAIETNSKVPEFGGRYQHPTAKGEIALSYHYRTANSTHLDFVPQFEKIPEHRLALDGKWDLTIGLWFETVLVHKRKDLNLLTNQTMVNLGADYTFAVGNGLNLILEHLMIATDQSVLGFENTTHLTGTTTSYPLGLFDALNAVVLYNWDSKDFILNMIYTHEFDTFSSYIMGYYNPATAVGFQQNDLVNQFTGPGIRFMLVYNH
ncbi:MAG: hypothetical protein P1U56_06245 [Saprospiraceae bacterium]|nr:hypothetical protein [Saprospiraceae bacterium]